MKYISFSLLVVFLFSACAPVATTMPIPTPTQIPATPTITPTQTPTNTVTPANTLTLTIAPTPLPITFIYQDDVSADDRALQEQAADKAYIYYSQYADLGEITIYTFSDLEKYIDQVFPAIQADIPFFTKAQFRHDWPNQGGTTAQGQNLVLINSGFSGWKDYHNLCYKAHTIADEMFHILQSKLIHHSLYKPVLDYGPEWILHGSAMVFSYNLADGLNQCDAKDLGLDYWRTDASDGGALLKELTGSDAMGKPKFWSVAPWAVDYLIQIAPQGEKSIIEYYIEIGNGKNWRAAFNVAFGLSIEDFYPQFEVYREEQKALLSATPAPPIGTVSLQGNVRLADESQKYQDYVISFCNLLIEQCLPGILINNDGSFIANLDPGDYKLSVNPMSGGEALGWYSEKGLVPENTCATVVTISEKQEIEITIDLHTVDVTCK